MIVKNLESLVECLKSEVYSDVDAYKPDYEQIAPYITDYDEVFNDDDEAHGLSWRYSEERMEVRTQGLKILLKKFGSELGSDGTPKYSCQSIYECIHDWVSQGNLTTSGIVSIIWHTMQTVKLVSVTPDAETTMAYVARVSNPNNQENPNYAGL